MKKISLTLALAILPILGSLFAQGEGAISGVIRSGKQALPYATIWLKDTDWAAVAGPEGAFLIEGIPEGVYYLEASMVGYQSLAREVRIEAGILLEVDVDFEDSPWQLQAVVVTGSRSFQRQTDAPVIVQVLNRQTLESVQANALSEGLCFQPGLRVESNCQTCNYSQLRMNGLGGGYSQILVNERAVFGPLVGLYGLEQFPAQLIERVEVVRGGGSALYGANAIGGTVNIITRRPERNGYDISMQQALINNRAWDQWFQGTASFAGEEGKSGLHLSLSRRNRQAYDHNGDGFTELPLLRNTSMILQASNQLAPRHELEVFLAHFEEKRTGGDLSAEPIHFSEQAEDRDTRVFIGGLDYRWKRADGRGGLSFFGAMQRVARTHYTGILPDEPGAYLEHMLLPPYGRSRDFSIHAGGLAHWNSELLGAGKMTWTGGAEFQGAQVEDRIEAYDYLIEQNTANAGLFLQNEWKLPFSLTLLSGLRADRHNMVSEWLFNPRFSLLYRLGENAQFRASWSSGFRPPQAFDADLHIAFAGGGIQRIQLAPGLKEERSQSWSTSMNWDRPSENQIYGFTLEAFHTRLNGAFALTELGGTEPGLSILEKYNGGASSVSGLTAEIRYNYKGRFQWESGLTAQRSRYDEPVAWSEQLPGLRDYLRTPEVYGYHVLTLKARFPLQFNWSSVLTGPMLAPRYGVEGDQLVRTPTFWENHFRIAYSLSLPKRKGELEFFAGVQNLTNAYQNDFDTGKYRDSNYVYGPARPRTFFAGVRLKK